MADIIQMHEHQPEPLPTNDSWQNLNSPYRRDHPCEDVGAIRGVMSLMCFYAAVAAVGFAVWEVAKLVKLAGEWWQR